MSNPLKQNWAGNLTYSSRETVTPRSLDHIRETVAVAPRVKALGTRHAFSSIADTAGVFLAMDSWNRVIDFDSGQNQVTVQAGIRYGDLAVALQERGWALPNLASLPHISVMGACATGTHGSGDGLGCLSTQVAGLKLVGAEGGLHSFTRKDDPELFPGVVVNLGALGVVVELTLDLVPAFEVSQQVFENLPFSVAGDAFEALMADAYSVSLFTDWKEPRFTQVWRKALGNDPDPMEAWMGAPLAGEDRHPLICLSAEHCTRQGGRPGPWFQRLPHFRMEFVPSFGEELQTEYLIPRSCAPEAIEALNALGEVIHPLLLISEIRSIREDDLWMSPHYGRPTVGLHFTWQKDWERVKPILGRIEEALEPFSPRPHWGKLSTLKPEAVRGLYPQCDAFRKLVGRMDPQRKFRNQYLDTILG